jgi:hypothetical protein
VFFDLSKVFGCKPFMNVVHSNYVTPFPYPLTWIWKGILTFIIIFIFTTIFQTSFQNTHFLYHSFYLFSHTLWKNKIKVMLNYYKIKIITKRIGVQIGFELPCMQMQTYIHYHCFNIKVCWTWMFVICIIQIHKQ